MFKFTNFVNCMYFAIVIEPCVCLFVFPVDLNALPCRPVRCRVLFEDHEPPSRLPTVSTVPDLADHPLGVYMCAVFLMFSHESHYMYNVVKNGGSAMIIDRRLTLHPHLPRDGGCRVKYLSLKDKIRNEHMRGGWRRLAHWRIAHRR